MQRALNASGREQNSPIRFWTFKGLEASFSHVLTLRKQSGDKRVDCVVLVAIIEIIRI